MATRTGSAVWSGTLKEGSGRISTESGVLDASPYGFNTRFEDEPGTNPEELIGAAHAGCFSMALANELEQAGIAASNISAAASVKLISDDGGFTITAVDLNVSVFASGAEDDAVEKAANTAKENCPVSKLLNAEITMDLHINPS
ncbi:OsmC family protein [Euryhalocaulis caribicus]|uniref:OsmC family protein n=1 Tax=Euryhalocaulis caribicus TaxID=1161401 RepID=UPI0003A4F858|nr:OsmC family protein [Euryhalocaulis caribicus]